MFIGPRKVRKEVKHQNIGGKKIDILFEVSIEEFQRKLNDGNWACYNFAERRPDSAGPSNIKLYYGKVDGLGYVVGSDELI